MADGPTAADGHARGDDSLEDGGSVGDDSRAASYPAFLAAGVPVDAIALALRALSGLVWDGGRIVADGNRVVDEWRCLHRVWMLV
jgi:hypothetical protein